MAFKIGTKVMAYGKSKHAGYGGTVVADWINYVLVLAEDQSYIGGYIDSQREGKHFQIDTRYCKKVK